MTLACTRRICE